MILLDTSIIIAYYLPESYSAQAQTYYLNNPDLTLSNLIELEVVAVIARLVRSQSLPLITARQTVSLFTTHLEQGFYSRLPLQTWHYQQAHIWVTRFDLPLKAPDSLHLAVAHLERLRLVTADRQLARNAEALGIAVELLVVA
ncbi:MAG: type II toxin-antitoxin system VapC family toxin [Caldilineaceae bacterium]|nr:type II toxin-antitoxin system VapC family toxin [Caldilineaceae bacterium]